MVMVYNVEVQCRYQNCTLFQYLTNVTSAFKHKEQCLTIYLSLTLSYLEGTDEPRSEYPLVRVSSSGQGLLGVKSGSSPSP